jgi:hypothetical protein
VEMRLTELGQSGEFAVLRYEVLKESTGRL